jgi:type I restriction enzyme S subunit
MTGLPRSWAEVEIVEVLEPNENGKPFQQGWSPQCENSPASENDWGVLKTTAVQHGDFWSHENKALPASLEPRPNIEVRPGDILMTCAGPRNRCGVACLVERTRPRLMMSGKMYRFRPRLKALLPKYLAYLIQRREAQSAIDRMKTGISDSGLNLTHDRFARLRVPIAPLREQHRIVTKVEELFSELDASAENLTRARAQLRTYRHALLKAAFEGKLTADWRAANADKLDAPKALLARIRAAREAIFAQAMKTWEAALAEWQTQKQVGDRPSRPRRTPDPEPPTAHQRANMTTLPTSWQWLQIADFAFVTKLAGFEYTKYVKYDEAGDLPVIKAENAGPPGFRETNYSFVRSDMIAMLRRSVLRGGDLLMVFVGAGTGNVGVVPNDRLFFLGPNIGMIRIEAEGIVTRFVELFLQSPLGSELKLSTVKAVAQPSLSMETIRQISIPMPSTKEQLQIVAVLDQRLLAVDRGEAEISEALARILALRQSILKHAFSGNLVPQDPSDEPAGAVLARLRARTDETSFNRNGRRRLTA